MDSSDAEWVPSFQRHFEREINAQIFRTVLCLGGLSAPVPSPAKCGLGTGEMEELLAFGRAMPEVYGKRKSSAPATVAGYEQQVKMDLRTLLRTMTDEGDESAQRDALELLIARKVRADYFSRPRLSEYLPVPAIGDERCAIQPTRRSRVVTWCGAAPEVVDEPKPGSAHYTCVVKNRNADDKQGIRRDLRILRFQCGVGEAWHVYAYSATPKDSVQRISRIAATRNTMELAAAISALTGAASLDVAAAFIRDNQKLMNTILREPLVVGYTEAGNNAPVTGPGMAHFGWLIGPRFGLTQKPFGGGEGVSMDHRPIQNSLAAAVSLPGWSNRAKVTVRTCWKSKKSIQGDSKGRCGGGIVLPDERNHYVELPGRIDAIHNLFVNRADPSPLGWETYEVVTDSGATLLIKGSNLWRSTEVTLGAQTADEIRVLPDMTGIVARFEKVKEPASLDGTSSRTVEVNIWTSAGNRAVGEAKIYPKKKGDAEWKLAWRSPRMIKDDEIALEMVAGTLPVSFHKIDVVVEGYDSKNAVWTAPVRLAGTVRGKTVLAKLTEIPLLGSGSEVRGSVWTFLRPDSAAVDVKATTDINAVYYANAAEAKVVTPAALKAGDKLTLTFPKRVAQAYPGYKQTTVTANAVPAALAPSLTNATWTTNAEGLEVLQYTVTTAVPVTTETAKLQLTVALQDGLTMDKTDIPLKP